MKGLSKGLQANFGRTTDFALGLPTDVRSRRKRQIQSQRYDYIYLNVTLDQDEVAKQEFCNHLLLLRQTAIQSVYGREIDEVVCQAACHC